MSLPPGFRFGVATAGFQVEGGYNGPGEPRNNWFEWESQGRVTPSGDALRAWSDYEHHLDRATAAGCDGFRLSVEWARCEPAPGHYDDEAFARYAAVLDACRARGMEPLVTLHHFTHPWWLGDDFWLRPESPEVFAGWASAAVARLGPHCTAWVTINELNILVVNTWVMAYFPPGRTGDWRACRTAIDHMLAAHVLAYAAVKAAQPASVVATNNYSLSAYEIDRMLTDVLVARRHGVARDDLAAWTAARRQGWRARTGERPSATALERPLRAAVARVLPVAGLRRAVDAVYASAHACTLDVTQVDFYNPVLSNHLRVPGHRSGGGRRWNPSRALWDDPPDADAFGVWVEANVEPGMPVWVVENGLCCRLRNGRAVARADGWDRVRYLATYLRTLYALVERGVPVGAYYHWTLADNYEWGSYEPAFGLYTVDRARGLRWSDRDAFGHDAAGALRRLAEGLRAGRPEVADEVMRCG